MSDILVSASKKSYRLISAGNPLIFFWPDQPEMKVLKELHQICIL